MAVKCPQCGVDLPAETRFCPRDGTSLEHQTLALASDALVAGDAAVPPPSPLDPTAVDPLIDRILDGRYAIKRPLGKGAMGAVYEAEQLALQKLVALKVLNTTLHQPEEFRKRFEREALAASRLSHPGCVSVLDFSHVARLEPEAGAERMIGMAYLVMELVRGELLDDRLARGDVPLRDAVAITRSLLLALGHAHGLDLVHRDVKPTNIMLVPGDDDAPHVKLLDFGLAKNVAQDSLDTQEPITQFGMVFGTPKYLSPEQAAAQLLDCRSDLYSTGVVLFEMVCGQPPFERDDMASLVRDHLVTAPPAPRGINPAISAELEAVVLKALVKNPDQRFQTAKEFLIALEGCPEAATPVVMIAPEPPGAGFVGVMRRAIDASWRGARAAVAWLRPHAVRLWHGPRWRLGVVSAGLLVFVLGTWLVLRPSRATKPAIATSWVPPIVVSPSSTKHLRTAVEYQQKLWCGDAIDELERALTEEPALRVDPEVVRTAIPCLRAKTQAKTMRFLIDRVGNGAKGELQAALQTDLKPDVRQGIERTLAALASGSR